MKADNIITGMRGSTLQQPPAGGNVLQNEPDLKADGELAAAAPLPNHGWPRNVGTELDLGLVLGTRVNLSATERRVATLPGRRTVKKDAEAR